MSFSSETKNELAQIIPEEKNRRLAELSALIRTDGALKLQGRAGIGLEIKTENAATARKIVKYIKGSFSVDPEVETYRSNRLKKGNVYFVRVPPGENVREMLNALYILDSSYLISPDLPEELFEDDYCRRAYLRGIFAGNGSVSNPDHTYHLEMLAAEEDFAEGIVGLMDRFGLNAKISRRKNRYVVYLKESEQIVMFLNIIGAHNALLSFENVRIKKDMRNRVNRLVNCETANLTKSISASVRQRENIGLIQRAIGLDKLPPSLRQAAEARLEYPDVSLKELGELMNPPIGKSGINHRMRKIEQMADKIQKKR